jgi:hypothetical protein
MWIGTNPFSPDTDGDGISDLLDPLPLSASNLSPANGIVWGAIALDDSDGDGIPNFLDDYPYGQYGGQLGTPDTDGDGIPDFIDPAPEDPYNTSPFNGLQWLGDALADADGDGVPNFHDWYPYDSALWDPLQDPDGDGLVKAKDPRPADPYNPSPVNGLNWGPDVYGDADGDGIPNFYDAYPYDSGNGFVPSEPDADGDGIPDSVDPSPWDYYNFSAANGVSWQGDARGDADNDGISNFYDQFPYDYYNGNVPVSDMDGDGIPDAEDPAPTDPTNLSPINGGLWYTAALADADGDGNPNFTDPWPYDPTNGNLPPEWDSPTADTDGDGIPNAQDPALADPLNFSIYNGTSWYGAANGDIDGDGIPNFRDEHPYDYYNGGYAGPDSDGDGIPDSQDPYPSDPTNGAGGTGGGGDPQPEPDTDGDGRPDSQDPYPNDPYDNADFDHDGIPDFSDPARSDPSNLSPFNGLEWYADVRGDADGDGILNFWDLEPYGPPPVDTDGDGLIDSIDPAPEDFYNFSPHNGSQWPSDALGDFDGDGIPNFFDVWPDDRLNGQPDTDMDGIPDPSDPAPGDPVNYSSYNDRNWYGTEALGDLDNDGRLNFFDRYPEDFYDGNPPVTDPDTDGDGLADSVDPAKDDPDNFSPHNQMPWPGARALDDDDDDGIKNFDDPEHNPKLPEPDPEPGPGPSCSCYWPSAPSVYASSFVLLNDNYDELTGPWTPDSKRDFETVTLKTGGAGAPKTEGLMPLAISLPDGYANGQRSIVIGSSGAGEVRIHAVRGNEEDCVYSNGMGFVLKQGDGWQYWVEGTKAGEVTLDYEFPESGEYREAHRPPGCGSADCITLNYDWSSADFSSTAAGSLTIQVVKVDLKVHQDKPDPNGIPPKYKNAPRTYTASNLFVVWPNHEVAVKVKLSAPFDQQQNLPDSLINWQVPGHNIPVNALEAKDLKWTLGLNNNTKEIVITIGGQIYKVHIKVQGVGFLTEFEAAALMPNAAAALLYYRKEAIDYGNTHHISAQKDAMRHAYWCALAVSTGGVNATDAFLVSTAHEFDNQVNKQAAFNSTMDMRNNEVGFSTNYQVNGLPDKAKIQADLMKKFASGEMYIWERPAGMDVGEEQSEGIIVKSNQAKIYP